MRRFFEARIPETTGAMIRRKLLLSKKFAYYESNCTVSFKHVWFTDRRANNRGHYNIQAMDFQITDPQGQKLSIDCVYTLIRIYPPVRPNVIRKKEFHLSSKRFIAMIVSTLRS